MADLDLIPGISFKGGERNPQSGIVGKTATDDSRKSWNDAIYNLENALGQGDYAYGGYDNALNFMYGNYGIPSGVSYQEAKDTISNLYNKYYAPTNKEGGDTLTGSDSGSSSSSGSGYTAEDIAYLQGIKQDYLDQKNRLDTTLAQGNQKIANDYGEQLDLANTDKTNQLGAYDRQRQDQTTTKGENYSQINNAANRGYTSLASILGRASGTGSSAFQELLPNVIGKDVYAKRAAANTTYGKNVQNIDQSQSDYLTSFDKVLADLRKQKDENEQNLISGVNTTRADLASKLGTIEGQLAAAAGGGTAAVRAAQAPYAAEVAASRDAIDNLFNKYFKAFTPSKASAAAPELSTYTMDRSQINAGNQGIGDATNPYAALLRKKLQEQA